METDRVLHVVEVQHCLWFLKTMEIVSFPFAGLCGL